MRKIKIGIICPSEIAYRRFLPSLQGNESFEYIGVAIANGEEWSGDLSDEILQSELKKADDFVEAYGGKVFHSYNEMLGSDEIDAIYLPLPPALHFTWARLALNKGKHVFVEKPSTTAIEQSIELVNIARANHLALHENYMFQYHMQINEIKTMLETGIIGSVHSYHAQFGFPMRSKNDFRYNKELGGGALLDAGGYVIKLASKLLGDSLTMKSCTLKNSETHDVDIYGSYMFEDDKKTVYIGEFGMDCEYQCSLTVWGSEGILKTDRIFTAPDSLEPVVKIMHDNELREIKLSKDSHFQKSIEVFKDAVENEMIREELYDSIIKQAKFVEQAKSLAEEKKDDKIQ